MVLERYQSLASNQTCLRQSGRVERVVGLSVAASGPAVATGELCLIMSGGDEHPALVTGFDNGKTLLQPLGHLDGIRPGDEVRALGSSLEIPWARLWLVGSLIV